MSELKELVFATRNRGKVAELQKLIGGLPLKVNSIDNYQIPKVEEDGDFFQANAAKKARAVSLITGLPSLADDSGLEVDALDGAPGVHSARYAGKDCDDAANNAKLLVALAGVAPKMRTARFRSALVLADSRGALGENVLSASGCCEGLILDEFRGTGGFGYDPLFFCPTLGMSFGEAKASSKNEISHRARAMKIMLPKLIEYFGL